MGRIVRRDRYSKPQGFSVAVGTKDPADTERVFNAPFAGRGRVHMPLQQTFWSAKFGMLQDQVWDFVDGELRAGRGRPA